ncbi:MFS transporter [Ruania rhizosphaerae]|uniref:MFS transporter n=1 Tax=Ruania rhizosphaerae TaxID=1840413 RepID=UPI001358F91E|nr:MFS transporter [Ruania rhizosphaerae]
MSTRSRVRSTSPHGFYGWRMVAIGAIALAATGPGQTVGISLFIDPLIADLGFSRSAISTAYLIGTLIGAFALPWVGRALDKFGARRTMMAIGFVFGAILIALSFVTSIVGLTFGFVGIRMMGQGALTLTATTMVALWFERRRGFAMGIVTAIGSLGISSTPLLLESLIASHGWQRAWMIEGFAVWAVVIPLAIFAVRDRPEALGQQVDGRRKEGEPPRPPARGATRAQVVRHPFFWLVTCAVAVSGMLATAVAFHQISLLTARGLSATEAAANFLPQTIAGLGITMGAGILMDRFASRWMIVASMCTLALALAWGVVVGPGWSAIGFGMALGASGSMIRAVEAAALPRAFGTVHLGSIRGLMTSVSVGGSALGPLLFAAVFDTVGSYGPVLLATAAIPIAVAVAALIVREPELGISRTV